MISRSLLSAIVLTLVISFTAFWTEKRRDPIDPVCSILDFKVDGILLMTERTVVLKRIGKPVELNNHHGMQECAYYNPNLPVISPSRSWNSFVGLDSIGRARRILGSPLSVRGHNLGTSADYKDVAELFSALGAPKPRESAIEDSVYSLLYRFVDGEVEVDFSTSKHGTSYTIDNWNCSR